MQGVSVAEASAREARKVLWLLFYIFVTFVTVFIVFSYIYFSDIRVSMALQAEKRLQGVAELKAREISSWMNERLRDAADLQQLLQLTGVFSGPNGSLPYLARKPELRKLLQFTASNREYEQVDITDTSLRSLFSLSVVHSVTKNPLLAATVARLSCKPISEPTFSDLEIDFQKNEPRIHVVFPICAEGSLLGVVIFKVNPNYFLLPLIKLWPVPSETGESLVVRRDGNSVVFLNDLRHLSGAMLKLRFPLSQVDLPASWAASGNVGVKRGTDYRGHDVVSFIVPILGTEWKLIAKEDGDELLASFVARAWEVVIISGLVILAACAIFVSLFHRSRGKYFRDILEEERKFFQFSAKYELMLQEANDIVLITDANLKIEEANNKSLVYYGYSRLELHLMGLSDLSDNSEKSKIERYQAELLQRGKSFLESVHRRKDGSTFPVEISSSVFFMGEEKKAFTIIRDISERKIIQEKLLLAKKMADSANASKSNFLATMSHEIRTPMNGIIGTISLLGQANLSPANAKLVENARRSSEILLSVVNDILDFSAIEADKLKIRNHPFSLRKILEDAGSIFAVDLARKKIRFEVKIDEIVPKFVSGDSFRIRQVVSNFISNAFKFSRENGTIVVEVSSVTGKVQSGMVRLKFAVHDSGIGISEAEQKNLFSPFFQVDNGSGREYSGSGLGLAICKRLVELMDGDIGVSSRLGGGSTFWFLLNLQQVLPSQKNPEAAVTSASGLSHEESDPLGFRVCIAEDNEVNRQVLCAMLESLGCTYEVACDGEETLMVLANGEFDVVLMDCHMPRLDGFSATARIRQNETASGGHLKIVALTADAMVGDEEACLAAGMDAYLAKPVYVSELRRVLREVCAVRRD